MLELDIITAAEPRSTEAAGTKIQRHCTCLAMRASNHCRLGPTFFIAVHVLEMLVSTGFADYRVGGRGGGRLRL